MQPPDLGSALLIYGPLGISTFSVGWAALKLYRDRERERAEHAKELAELYIRAVGKAETWMEKYHDLSKSLNDVLESIERRFGREHK